MNNPLIPTVYSIKKPNISRTSVFKRNVSILNYCFEEWDKDIFVEFKNLSKSIMFILKLLRLSVGKISLGKSIMKR